jgi:hypothetical protein
MKMTLSTKKVYAVLAIFLIGAVLSGAIYARAVGGEIKACVNTSGAVYIIGDGFKKTTCAKGEQLLSWNQQGPKGDQGDKGDTGDQGLQGASGNILHLFDGSGQDLGVLVRGGQIGSSYTTYIKLDNGYDALADFVAPLNCSVAFPCVPFLDPVGTELYFPQINCTGDTFMRVGQPQEIFYENFHRNSGYFVQRLDTFIAPVGNADARHLSSKMGQNGCVGDDNFINNTVLIHYITLPFTEPLTWPLEVR